MSYQIIYQGGTAEIEEKKSRFIAHIFSIASEEEALTQLEKIRKKYWDARHNCYAYVLGDNPQTVRCSDDGEPQGTAGRPILEILQNAGINNCLAVVTRYFGGTLLGTGGLVRAYQKATQAGLAASTILTQLAGCRYTIRLEYTGLGKIQYILASRNIPVLDTRYTDSVEIDIILNEKTSDADLKELNDAVSGQLSIQKGSSISYGMSNGQLIILE